MNPDNSDSIPACESLAVRGKTLSGSMSCWFRPVLSFGVPKTMNWFQGTSTGNHRIWSFPVNFPFNQSIDKNIPSNWFWSHTSWRSVPGPATGRHLWASAAGAIGGHRKRLAAAAGGACDTAAIATVPGSEARGEQDGAMITFNNGSIYIYRYNTYY